MLYKCDPEKNEKCSKTHCYINGGECEYTTKRKCSVEETEQHED